MPAMTPDAQITVIRDLARYDRDRAELPAPASVHAAEERIRRRLDNLREAGLGESVILDAVEQLGLARAAEVYVEAWWA